MNSNHPILRLALVAGLASVMFAVTACRTNTESKEAAKEDQVADPAAQTAPPAEEPTGQPDSDGTDGKLAEAKSADGKSNAAQSDASSGSASSGSESSGSAPSGSATSGSPTSDDAASDDAPSEPQVQAVPAVGVEQRLGVPAEVFSPPWMSLRRKAQLDSVDKFSVFHEFRFADRVAESQIQFLHVCVDDAGKDQKPVHYDHGSGLAVADVDGDGLLDIYFVTQMGRNELWRNLGDGRFENVTDDALAIGDKVSVAASFADIDNDGDPDLYVTTVKQGNHLFENDGQGQFSDITSSSGLGHVGHSSGAVFFDFDRDGLLDVFLCNVGVYTTDERGAGGYFVGFKDAFSGHLKPDERNERSLLFRNLGQNQFADVTEKVGLMDESWTGDACPVDCNRDGWPDLYVLNMQGNDQYYENVNGESFVKKSRDIFPKTPWGAMGIGVFDFDNDGDMDIFVTDMHSDMSKDIIADDRSELSLSTFFEAEKLKTQIRYPESLLQSGGMSIFGNAFYRNDGEGKYVEVSDQIGAENYWPWGLSLGDFNADGFEDMFVASSMNYPYRYGVNSLLLNNRGQFLDSEFILGIEPRREGRTAKLWFELDCSGADKDHKLCEGREGRVLVWGSLGTRSSVCFDLDDDGDLDIVTNEFNDGPMVLVSDLAERKEIRYLKVSLAGSSSNRSGIGSRVTVTAAGKSYTKMFDGKSGYLSQSLMPLYFGLDAAEVVDEVVVTWPSGRTQTVPGPIATNSLLEVQEPDSE